MKSKVFGLCVLSTAAFILSGCAVPNPEPVISGFNEASVSIQLDGLSLELSDQATRNAAFAKADVIAANTCARGPKRRAEFASSRNIPTGEYTYVVELLYLCLR